MKKSLVASLADDLRVLLQSEGKVLNWANICWLVLGYDTFPILFLFRLRKLCRTAQIPGVGRLLRGLQGALFGIEIGIDVELGAGVNFVHSHGIVIGGNSTIGSAVKFMGSNTVGTASDNGYPVIQDAVMIGAGARILGPVTVGRRAVVGANAVVLDDVPEGVTVVGIPARPSL